MQAIIIFFFLLLSSIPVPSSSIKINHNRRILHHPFFPIDSLPPTSQPPLPSPQPQPQPQQQPKYPFSSLSPPNKQDPFFPFYPSPPPPPSPSSSTSLNTFPANISSLILPHTSSKPISKKLVATIAIAISISLCLLSAAIAAAAFLLYHRRFTDDKASRTDSLRLFPPNTATSDGGGGGGGGGGSSHKSSTSSEFLYLGTLRRGIDEDHHKNKASYSSNAAAASSMPAYQKLGSPELHPLPPLPRQNFRRHYLNDEVGDNENDQEEEFFSPRGSSEGKDSPTATTGPGSRYRRVMFVGVESEHFRSRSSNSRTASYPSSNSASPVSTSPLMPLNLSPRSLRSRSPDSLVNFPAPSRLSPMIPQQTMAQSQPKSNIFSPATDSGVPVKLPPPPPPPPPPRFWEIPVVLENPEPVSPLEQAHNLETIERCVETPKPKLKPLHWDKVRASSDRAMVWDQLKSSSFQLNEEMIETLFVVNGSSLAPKDTSRRPILPVTSQENQVLDPKKSQNIAILLRALNVTIDEVCEALLEGSADSLGTELLESLLKMAPTKEEERKLKDFKDESPFKLGPAEKFLKAVIDIPFAFKRVDAMLYRGNFDSEVEYLKRSFETLEAACEELRNSRMFLKLLEAVLKTGNRMNVGTNRGDAHAFKLDTLLKLVDVKGSDGKTTVLHFVVQEISRAEGSRLAGVNQSNPTADKNQQSAFQDDIEFRKLGLEVVSSLSGELTNVKKAAAMDSDILSSEVTKLAVGIAKIEVVLKVNEEIAVKESTSRRFSESMNEFLKKAEAEITNVKTQESVALSVVKEITEYFHGNSAKEEAHPFRIFMVVRDFLSILDQVCKEVGKINERSTVFGCGRQFPVTVNSSVAPVFPGFIGRRQYGSSEDESLSSP